MCFNPHTHAGCDFGVIQARQEAVVSIHTPTQGVTIVIFNGINISIVSIHTPTQGVTSHLSSVSSMECFNPHTHAGCDLTHHHHSNHYYVSIHTPTQGVTASPDAPLRTACFNPHTHAGCDSISNNIL